MMRRLILSIIMLSSLSIADAQFPTERYYRLEPTSSVKANILAYIPYDSAANQSPRPCIFFFPGSGEQGGANNTLAKARQYNFGTFISSGQWTGSIHHNGDSVYPYYFIIQLDNNTTTPGITDRIVKGVLDQYGSRLDTMRIYYTGLSLGAQQAFATEVTPLFSQKKAAASWLFSAGEKVGTGGVIDSMKIYARIGGHLMYMIGESDPNKVVALHDAIDPMNEEAGGSAVGRTWNAAEAGGAGHCCWGTFFDPTKKIDIAGNKNGYEWLLQFDKYPKAMSPQTLNLFNGETQVQLNGMTKGWDKNAVWSIVSGNGITIHSPNSDTTLITGLLPENQYQFKLRVQNGSNSNTYSESITTVTVSAPSGNYLKSSSPLSRPKLF